MLVVVVVNAIAHTLTHCAIAIREPNAYAFGVPTDDGDADAADDDNGDVIMSVCPFVVCRNGARTRA